MDLENFCLSSHRKSPQWTLKMFNQVPIAALHGGLKKFLIAT